MSSVFEPVIAGGIVAATNGKTNGNGASGASRQKAEIKPIGLNGSKVVAKRYSLKDAKGEGIETWDDISTLR